MTRENEPAGPEVSSDSSTSADGPGAVYFVEKATVLPEEHHGADADGARGWGSRLSIQALAAFLTYGVASVVIWGIPVLGHFTTRYVGVGGGDANFYRWALGWMPWALIHGKDPLFTDRIFAPGGADLAWSAFIPGPAVLLWPVTRLFGTLASYNLTLLLAPPLAGWAAYLVCRRVTGSFWPSLVGGYLFGFSTYMTGQMHEHSNLVLIFPVPLMVYLVIRRVADDMSRVVFVLLLALLLLGLFSISIELFATAALFGSIAFLGSLVAANGLRRQILSTIALAGVSFAIACGVLFFPYVLPLIRNAPAKPVRPLSHASVDLLSFVIPRSGALVGGARFARLSDRFTAGVIEDAAYIGIALLVMLVAYAVIERRHRETWALLGFIVVGSVLAMGPVLHVAGQAGPRLPGSLLAQVPFMKNATPQRFPAYTALAIGVIAAIWLWRAHGRWAWTRWALVLVGGFMLLPSITTPPWHPVDATPPFFTRGEFRSVLRSDEIVFAIPTNKHEEMGWQESANYDFRMPEGYVGIVPAGYRKNPLYRGLSLIRSPARVTPSPHAFSKWLMDHRVTAVVVADAALARFEPLLRSVGLELAYTGGGVSVWRSLIGR